MIRMLSQSELGSIDGGADLNLGLGALGNIFLDLALPALGALASGVNELLLGIARLLTSLGSGL